MINPAINQRNQGYVLVISLVLIFVMTAIGVSLASIASAKYSKTMRTNYGVSANYGAEAGISTTISKLYDNPSLTGQGYSAETTLYNNSSGRVTYSVKVDNGPNSLARVISSIGKYYLPNTVTPLVTQYIQVVSSRNTTSSPVVTYAGPGGINLASGSNLKSPYMHSLGKIILSGSGTVLGDSSNDSTIEAANIACLQTPTDPNSRYPFMCLNADKPITTGNNISYGMVCASGQIVNTDNLWASSNNPYYLGLKQSCVPSRNIIAPINRANLLTSAGATNTYTSSNCNSTTTLTPAAGTYNGDTTITGPCNLSLPYIMYIKGNVTFNNSTIVVPNSAGTIPPIIMSTGTMSLNNVTVQRNSNGTSARFISFNSSDYSDTTSADRCTQLDTCTGFNDNSSGWSKTQNSLSTIALSISNNTTAPEAEFTAYFGQASIGNATIGSLAAQKINIQSSTNAVINNIKQKSVTDLNKIQWVVSNYARTFNP